MPYKKNKAKLLSVIVPIFRQEKTIVEDLGQIEAALKKIPKDYDYEIIGVVDGRVDKSYENAKKIKSSKVKIFAYEENHGKGYAVRYGMARAKGDPIAFIDAGMDINPSGIPLLLAHMDWYKSDVIVGSIRHSASKVTHYPLFRRIQSTVYHLMTKIMFRLNITDSQRGIKIFRRKVLEKVLPRLLVKRFAFDIEMLAVARHLGFKNIHDGPVELNAEVYRKNSAVKLTSAIEVMWDTLAVFYRLNILHYYDDSAKRNWVYDKDLDMKVNI